MLVKRNLLLSAALLTGYLISPSYGGGTRIVVRHQRLAMLMGVLALLVAMSCLDVAQAVEFCGDNICGPGETSWVCSEDCYCGDGFCDSDEEADGTCCDDCGCPSQQECIDNWCVVDSFCGDAICDSQETIQGACCEDCGCSPGELCSDNICAVDPSPLFVDGFESRGFNDPFSAAIDLGSAVIVNITGNNDGYTGEVGEPAQSGDITSAWWQWTAPSNGTLTINTFGSTFDTVLTVATGNSVANLVVVAQNDDEPGGGVHSEVTFSVTSGVTYFCAVDGFQDLTGDIALNLSFGS